MTQTMREKLIEAGVAAIAALPIVDANNPGGELDVLRRREAVQAIVYAILEAMREPNVGAVRVMHALAYDGVTDWCDLHEAMIDHIRSGK